MEANTDIHCDSVMKNLLIKMRSRSITIVYIYTGAPTEGILNPIR